MPMDQLVVYSCFNNSILEKGSNHFIDGIVEYYEVGRSVSHKRACLIFSTVSYSSTGCVDF